MATANYLDLGAVHDEVFAVVGNFPWVDAVHGVISDDTKTQHAGVECGMLATGIFNRPFFTP